jgi:hypothetical protein
MHLVKIGNRVVNMANVTEIALNWDVNPSMRAVLVTSVNGSYSAFEGSEASYITDWCRRNARDVQDWRGEQQDRGEEQQS